MRPRYRDRRFIRGSWIGSEQLVADAGITYRQLDYWCTQGYVQPDSNNPGSGRGRSFSATEAQIVVFIAELVRAGVRPSDASRLARAVAEQDVAHIGSLMLVAGDDDDD